MGNYGKKEDFSFKSYKTHICFVLYQNTQSFYNQREREQHKTYFLTLSVVLRQIALSLAYFHNNVALLKFSFLPVCLACVSTVNVIFVLNKLPPLQRWQHPR